MAKLIYMMNTSLDGYTEDEHGGFAWTAPQDEEVHTWIFAHVSSCRTADQTKPLASRVARRSLPCRSCNS
jgi:hypothetical protein